MSTTQAPTRAGFALTPQHLQFAYICLVWGGTWLAMKVGIETVPPAIFSGIRWTFAGLAVLGVEAARGHRRRIGARDMLGLVPIAFLLIVVNQAVQLYALRLVTSGIAAVISAALTPIALLGIGAAMGQERITRMRVIAIGIGIAGVFLLFGPQAAQGDLSAAELLGAAGILVSTLAYCWGSLLIRPMMRRFPPVELAAVTNLMGGVALIAGSLAFEPGAVGALRLAWGWDAWFAWLYLVFPGAIGATLMYYFLVRDWGAARAGTYAFVSPVIAVIAGMVLLGEKIGGFEALGMATMLVGAALALRPEPARTPAPAAKPGIRPA
jgi:drug/metabolite transporter (DMT)-like permease